MISIKPCFVLLRNISIGILLFLTYPVNAQTKKISYDFTRPAANIALPDVLKEVSGIVCLDETTLACVQDENGEIYIYDTTRKTILNSYTFSNEGDYEGIAIAGDVLYILRSDGVLFEVSNFKSDKKVENTYHLNIPSSECEGLCYDKTNNRLLIAPKGKPTDMDEHLAKKIRFIYCFDLDSKRLCSDPLFPIHLPIVERFMQTNNISFPFKLEKDGDKKEKEPKLRISDIAINPQSNKIYILAASENLLYVFSNDGDIEQVFPLNKQLFPKAEGITFNNKGDLFISNEGENGPATLLIFNLKS